jgi:hypothetical protein
MKPYHGIFVACAVLQLGVAAQSSVRGQVTDAGGKPIAFAAIGIPGTINGTLSDEDGNFSFEIKGAKATDSVKIGAIGYQARTISLDEATRIEGKSIRLSPAAVQLKEVVVKGGKPVIGILGNKRYNRNVYCSFTGYENKYKGTEAAIRAGNKKARLVRLLDFNFCILKNTSADSVPFRLNFYENKDGMPGANVLKQPVYFRTAEKNGVVKVNLKPHDIAIEGDFFISLECLRDDMGRDNLNFSGSVAGPAYFKVAAFSDWQKVPLMGLDFNVTVEYRK